MESKNTKISRSFWADWSAHPSRSKYSEIVWWSGTSAQVNPWMPGCGTTVLPNSYLTQHTKPSDWLLSGPAARHHHGPITAPWPSAEPILFAAPMRGRMRRPRPPSRSIVEETIRPHPRRPAPVRSGGADMAALDHPGNAPRTGRTRSARCIWSAGEGQGRVRAEAGVR
jgi:hypothetical protein